MEPNLIPLWVAVLPAVLAAAVFAFIAVRLTLEFREKRQHAGMPGLRGEAREADVDAVHARLEVFVIGATTPDDPAARELMERATGWLRGCEHADDESAHIAACDERFRAAEFVLDDMTLDEPEKMKKLLQLFEPQEPPARA